MASSGTNGEAIYLSIDMSNGARDCHRKRAPAVKGAGRNELGTKWYWYETLLVRIVNGVKGLCLWCEERSVCGAKC